MASIYLGSVLGAVGHLANFGQLSEIGISRALHRENMNIAKAALQQDSLALRLDLLGALKEDIRDHYANHTGQVDTLLIITTLLFTFGLATLQFSDPFVLKTEAECPDCLEVRNPWLCYVWITLVASVLIFPFWSLVMALWCKFQLDRWLGSVSKKLNVELRWAVRERAQIQARAAMEADEARREQALGGASEDFARQASADSNVTRSRSFLGRITGRSEARRHTDPGPFISNSQGMLSDPAAFVDEYQDQFQELWADECAWLIETSTCIVWFSATFAALLTALMFGTFLANRQEQQSGASALFSGLMTIGFLGPGVVMMRFRCRRRNERTSGLETFHGSRRASVAEQRRQPLLRFAQEERSSHTHEDASADTGQPEGLVRSVTEPPRRGGGILRGMARAVRTDSEQ